MLHRQNNISWRIVNLWKTVFKGTSHHRCDQLIHIRIFAVLRHNKISIPKNRYFITNFKDLIHFMGNVDKGNPLFFQHPHHLKEFIHFLYSKRRSRFIQNDNSGVIRDGFGDLAHLPLGN